MKLLLTLVLLLTSSIAHAWDEKWPTGIEITPTNFLSTFLRANFGRLGDSAAEVIDRRLNDPSQVGRLSAAAAKQIRAIWDRYQRARAENDNAAQDAAARELARLIEADLGGVSATTQNLALRANFSPHFGVVKLTWKRQISQNACQRSVCQCADGSRVPFPNSGCYSAGGVYLGPPSCQHPIDVLNTEASYKIYRNDKLLATFGRQIVRAGNSYSVPLFDLIPGVSGSISYTVLGSPPSAQDAVFYDYDAQSLPAGLPLFYRVESANPGCSEPYAYRQNYNNMYAGISYYNDRIVVDQNGDGRPEFYPVGAYFIAKLPEAAPHLVTVNPSDEQDIAWYSAGDYRFRLKILPSLGLKPGRAVGSAISGRVHVYVDGLKVKTLSVQEMVVGITLSDLSSGRDRFSVVLEYEGDENLLPGYSELKFISLYRD